VFIVCFSCILLGLVALFESDTCDFIDNAKPTPTEYSTEVQF